MWDAWSIDEGLIYAILTGLFPLTAYQQSYGIGQGAGADFSTQRPARIYKASILNAVTFSGTTTATSATITTASTAGLAVGMTVIGTGVPANSTILSFVANTSITISYACTASGTVTIACVGLNRAKLDIVNAQRYYAHNDLGATATTPEELYPDYNVDGSGNARLYIWPVVSEFQKSYIEIDIAVSFTAWTLVGNYLIPPGYQDAIEWALAFRCLPGFGEAVNPSVAQVVIAAGQKAEQRIREMNAMNRQIPATAASVPDTQPQPAAQAGVR